MAFKSLYTLESRHLPFKGRSNDAYWGNLKAIRYFQQDIRLRCLADLNIKLFGTLSMTWNIQSMQLSFCAMDNSSIKEGPGRGVMT